MEASEVAEGMTGETIMRLAAADIPGEAKPPDPQSIKEIRGGGRFL